MNRDIIDPFQTRVKPVPVAETAALDTGNACPVCGKAMQPVNCRNTPALACIEHRIVLPRLNPES